MYLEPVQVQLIIHQVLTPQEDLMMFLDLTHLVLLVLADLLIPHHPLLAAVLLGGDLVRLPLAVEEVQEDPDN